MRLDQIIAVLRRELGTEIPDYREFNEVTDELYSALTELETFAKVRAAFDYPYIVTYDTGDEKAGFTSFAAALEFWKARRPYAVLSGRDHDGESDGLTDEEREAKEVA